MNELMVKSLLKDFEPKNKSEFERLNKMESHYILWINCCYECSKITTEIHSQLSEINQMLLCD